MIGDFSLLYGNDEKMCDAVCMAQILYDDGSYVYNSTFEATLVSIGSNFLDFNVNGDGEISYDSGETWETFGVGDNKFKPINEDNSIKIRSKEITWIKFTSDTYKEIYILNAIGLTNASEMCYFLTNLEKFLLVGLNKIINFDYAWFNCSSLDHMHTFSSAKSISFVGSFMNCFNLRCIRGIDTTGVKSIESTKDIFFGCDKLVNPDNEGITKITGQYGFHWINETICP